jgi:sugar phosphate isomerase/epimerase
MKTFPNRRRFLTAAAALAAASKVSLVQARNAAGALKLGVASYSLRKLDRQQAIEVLKKLKVSNVSIKSFHLPYELSQVELKSGSNEFRNAGIDVLSGGNIDLKDPAQLRNMFEYAKHAGIPMMVCAPSHETMDQVEALVKEYDIRIAIHNHGPEDRHFPSPESALLAVDGRDYRMGLCVDIGHTTRTGADVVEWIRRSGPRLFDVHVKDLRDLLVSGSQCVVGEGAMPIVSIFQELKRMNYQGGVMLEYEIDADDPLLGMAQSVSYMRGVLDGLST